MGTWVDGPGGEKAEVRRRFPDADVRMDDADEAALDRPEAEAYEALRACDGRVGRAGEEVVDSSGVGEVMIVGRGTEGGSAGCPGSR
jgi:hypothetical protein